MCICVLSDFRRIREVDVSKLKSWKLCVVHILGANKLFVQKAPVRGAKTWVSTF